jgi:hypothetical protein
MDRAIMLTYQIINSYRRTYNMKGNTVSSNTLLDASGYSSGLTSSLLPWFGSLLISAVSVVWTVLRTRAKSLSTMIGMVSKHESVVNDLDARLKAIETDGLSVAVEQHELKLTAIDGNINALRAELTSSNQELRRELREQFTSVIDVLKLIKKD